MYLQMAGHTKVNKQLKSMRLLLRIRDRISGPAPVVWVRREATTLPWVKQDMGRD